MSFSTTINFDNAANFIYDSSKIEFAAGVAKLKTINNPLQTFSQDFSSSVGFSYDSNKSEFNAGILRQLNKRPTGATFYASFTNNENGSWGDGSLTGTLENGASVAGGQLDLTGGASKRIIYNPTLKLTGDPQRGTIRVHYRPNYTGNPSANQLIFHVLKTSSDLSNQIELYHDTASAFRISLKSSANAPIVTGGGLSSLSMTAGTLYVIELNYDFTLGETRLFVNGTQQGPTYTNTFTRDSNQAHFQIGNESGNTNFRVDDVILFNSVVHTANHAGSLPYSYEETEYLADIITLPQFSYTFPENIVTFTSLALISNGFERWTIDTGLGQYYFDGANWVVSNGTYAQASTAAQIVANIASFTVGNNIVFRVYTTASNNQATVSDLVLTYTGRKYDTSDPFIITNAGIYVDAISLVSVVASIVIGSGIQYIINFDGVDYYHNGANWVASNGSYAQSNTIGQIQSQYTSLSAFVALGGLIKFKVLLRSDTGMIGPEITSLSFSYDFFGVPPVEINECIVYSFIEDILQDIPDFTALNAKLYVENTSTINQGGKLFVPFKHEVLYNTVGYAEISVINTVESQKKISFSIEYLDHDGKTKTVKLPSKVVPDQVSINLATLLSQ